jgi:hypothetical protein
LIDAPRWSLTDFVDRLDAWIDLEQPDRDLRLMVTAWILTRYTDPYQGVRREPGFDNCGSERFPGLSTSTTSRLSARTSSSSAPA